MDTLPQFLIILSFYFAPTLVSLCNKQATWQDRGGIFAINLFLGWTILGYLIAAGMAQLNFKDNARIREAEANFYLREDEKYRSAKK